MNGHENVITSANRTGFETQIFLGDGHNRTHRYVAAAALTAEGDILGSSYVYDMENGKPVILSSNITSVFPPASFHMSGGRVAVGTHSLGAGLGIMTLVVVGLYVARHFWVRRPRMVARYNKIGPED